MSPTLRQGHDHRRTIAGSVVAAALIVAADGATATPPALAAAAATPAMATEYPVTIDNCGKELVIEAAPQNVVVTDTSLAEPLVALGLEDRIVGTYFDFENGGIDADNRTVLDTLTILGGEGGNYPSREQIVSLGPDFHFAFGDGDYSQDGAPTRDDMAEIGAAIYDNEAFGCEDGEGTVENSFEEITELGIIFDRQAEAQALVEGLQGRLDAVEEAVDGADRPTAIYWDAYDFDDVRLLPFGIFHDAVRRAGGEIAFADVTDAQPVSKEQIATSDIDVVFAVDYGADTTTPLLPQMEELVANTPAGQPGGLGVVAITNYPPSLHAVDLVEDLARVLHPDLVN